MVAFNEESNVNGIRHTLLAMTAAASGCVTSVPGANARAEADLENAKVPVTAPHPLYAPVRFPASYEGQGRCPPEYGEFLVPWRHSLSYNPSIVFIRAPAPVPTCVKLPEGWNARENETVFLERTAASIRVVPIRP